MTVILDLKTLYEIDDSLWLEETIELLKAKKFEGVMYSPPLPKYSKLQHIMSIT